MDAMDHRRADLLLPLVAQNGSGAKRFAPEWMQHFQVLS
jgi:hypothetical protein